MITKKAKKGLYFEGIGRRKEASARVRLVETGTKHVMVIND